MSYRDAIRQLASGPLMIAGTAAALLAAEARAQGVEAHVIEDSPAPDIAWVARLGAIADPSNRPPETALPARTGCQTAGGSTNCEAVRTRDELLRRFFPHPPARIEALDTRAAARLAAIHATGFARPWSTLEFEGCSGSGA